MAQTRHTEQDARGLAEKLATFADSLSGGELAAFEAFERRVSMLIPTEEVREEATTGASENERQALWYRLVSS